MNPRVLAFLLFALVSLAAPASRRAAVLSQAVLSEVLECTPVDCAVGEWTPCGSCSASCGGGTQALIRDIRTYPSCGGAPCGALTDTQSCGTDCCPVDCVVGPWSEFDSCTKECGGGTHTRTRTVTTEASCGGAQCPTTTETEPCNTQCCPVDCAVGEWTPEGSCSVSCGGGTQTFIRSISTYPSCGGASCDDLTDTRPCNTDPCPVDCVVGPWGEFDPCTKECGGGTHTRTRLITTPQSGEGVQCPTTTETEPCNTQCCPVDCVVGQWSSCGPCSVSCGIGTQSLTRSITVYPSCGGASCGDLSKSQDCDAGCCPVDCVVGPWGQWTDCTATCGRGTQTHTRPIVTSASCNGNSCPPTTETQECNTGPCPAVGCSPGYWKNHLSAWTAYNTRSFDVTLGVSILQPDLTLVEALNLRGNGLVLQLTAAYLNSIFLPGYPYTTAQVIALAQSVNGSNTSEITSQLNLANDSTGNMCPLH